jgi:hypothetical protein
MRLDAKIDAVDPQPTSAMHFRKHYEWTHDGTEWRHEWTCTGNDRCSICDTETEPPVNEDVEAVSW